MHPLLGMPRTTARVDGVLLVDKPAGMTSHDVVAVARRSLGVRRIGHTGTLDPFATGLLVLLVGQATRLARFMPDEPKIYDATITFGAETDTDDLTGNITHIAEPPSADRIDAATRALTGTIRQVPPAYSAKRVAGQRAYAAARAGAPLTLTPVEVTVREWRIRARGAESIDVTIICDGGTYIRALARDLGRLTLSAAHLTALRRIRSGLFDVANARTMEELRAGDVQLAASRAAIPEMPPRELTEAEVARIRHGQTVAAQSRAPVVALIDSTGDLVGIAERKDDLVYPCVVLQHEL